MPDYNIKIGVDSTDAEKKVSSLDQAVEKTVKPRNLKISVEGLKSVADSFSDLDRKLEQATNNIQNFYKVSKNIPGLGDKVQGFEKLVQSTAKAAASIPETTAALKDAASAGNILERSFGAVGSSASGLINNLAKTGFAIFAVKESVGLLQSAFGGFFNQTIGREAELRATILKTQTTLASTSKVIKNGKEVTDPYEKIVSLTGEVRKNIDSIRERSIALAGVTSGQVIEVFGIVATQISQIGGGLKDAEDLAISFSAALGTFGIPIQQARQEINSLLQGQVTQDSYLAKSLGITSADIQKARGEAGGVVAFIQKRLEGAVAGQRIAAEGLSGVVSNIVDLAELVGQRFGSGLLDPLLGGLSRTFEFLFGIRDVVFEIAESAGKGIGSVLANTGSQIADGSSLFSNTDVGAAKLGEKLKQGIEDAFKQIALDANRLVAPLKNIFEEVAKTVAVLFKGLAELGVAFVGLKLDVFKTLVQVVSNAAEVVTLLAASFSGLLSTYASILNTDIAGYFAEVNAQFKVLGAIGALAIPRLIVTVVAFQKAWGPLVAAVKTAVAKIIATLSGLAAVAGAALARTSGVIKSFADTLNTDSTAGQAFKNQITAVGTAIGNTAETADDASKVLGGLGGASEVAGNKLKNVAKNFLSTNAVILAAQVAIAVLVDLYGRWQKAQDKIAGDKKAEEALKRLRTAYKDVGDKADSAAKRAKEFDQTLVNNRYQEAVKDLQEVNEKLGALDNLLKRRNATTGLEDVANGIKTAGAFIQTETDKIVKSFQGDKQPKIIFGIDFRGFTTEGVKEQLEEQRKKLQAQADKFAPENDPAKLQDDIKIQADNRKSLEKEILELRREQENQLFQLRQQQASKEVEIFKAAGELRILQLEKANAKLIEGEEGASAAALEALNTYIATRERGELDIEASKQELAIELGNFQKQIEDYKYENAKKIAEIQKKAGEYQTKVSEYAVQMAQQAAQAQGQQPSSTTGPVAAAGGVSEGFRVGSTGDSTGPHLDIRGNDRESVLREAMSIVKAWQKQGLEYIEAPNAKIDLKNIKDDKKLEAALRKEQLAHDYTRGRAYGASRGAIDISVPKGTLVPVPASAPGWDPGGGGITAKSLNTGNSLLHGMDGSKATKGGAMGMPPPTSPEYADQAGPAVQRYEESVRSLTSTLERFRALQEALTNAKTAAAFDEIAKAAIPKVALEQYKDQLKETEVTLAALAATADKAYDPERLKIEIDRQTKIAINQRELDEIIANANKRKAEGKITEAELKKLQEDINKRKDEYLKKLGEEEGLRKKALDASRQQARIEELRAATSSIPFDLKKAQLQATSQMAQAFNGDDPRRQRAIEAEVKIAEKRIELEQSQTLSSAQLQAELAKFAEKTRSAAESLGAMDLAVKQYQEKMALLKDAAKSIADGTKTFAKSILSGEDIGDAFETYSQGIADKFLTTILDSAFKPLEDGIFSQLQQFLGGEDPTKDLQAQNNAELQGNTTALQALTTALGGQITSAAPGQIPSTLNPGAAPEGTLADSFKNPGIIPSTVKPGTGPQVTTPGFGQLPNPADLSGSFGQTSAALSAFTTTLPDLAGTTKGLAQTTEAAQANLNTVATEAAKSGPSFEGLGKAVGGAVQAFASISQAIAGIQSIGEGGTYGILTGIAGILGAAGSIFGAFGTGGIFAGKKAAGGPVSANRAYLVGEQGPEMFYPDTDGQITTSDKTRQMMSNMAGGGGAAAAAMAAMSSKSETIAANQSRAMAKASSPENVKLQFAYQSEVINDVEYVTSDQFRKGMADSAERGKLLAFQALQNNVSARRRIGI